MKKLWLIFLLVGPAQAAVLPDGTGIEAISNPTGGLNSTDPSFKITSNFSPYMRNVFIDDMGITGINGFQTLGSTAVLARITGIFPFVRETGQTTFLVTDSSITLETADFNAYTFVSSNSNSGTLLTWMQVRNKMWGFNGVDAPITWDGTNKQTLDGTKGTPNVPKFRYGAYWQERVWGFNTTAGASDLAFSAITSTDATILAPDDSRAWPNTNILRIDQGNGEVGTALWVYNAQLKCGKERSQYTIYGTNVSNYFARKDVSNSVGVVSNESVVNLDASSYYLSDDGIYRNEERISDTIIPDVDAIDKGTSKIVTDSWEVQADFGRGNFFGSTATPSGLLQPITKGYGISGGAGGGLERVFPSGILGTAVDNPPPLDPSTTFYGPVQFEFLPPGQGDGRTSNIDPYARLLVDRLVWAFVPVGGCDLNFASITIQNNRTGQTMKAQLGMNPSASILTAFFTTSSLISPIFDGFDLLNSTMSVKVEGCGLDIVDLSDNAGIHFINSTTVQFISDVATASMVTAWGNFDSERNTNGGDILYFLRSSTSVINISTKVWSPVTPGSIIGEPTINNYIQWASTIMSVSTFASISNVDNVEINHIEGSGSINRAFAIDWKNRYWLAVTTNSGSAFKVIYVKSRITNENPNAWMPIEGINVACFAKSNNILYGGSSSTGTVYRLDFGTNYDGNAIQYIYDTPDMILGNNYASKNILKYLLDADKDTNLTLSLGTSIDFGSYSTKSISLNGTGRSLQVIKGVTNPAKTLRIRLTHSLLDKRFTINDFSVLYQPTEILEPK